MMKYTEMKDLVPEFVSKGMVVLSPEILGIPSQTHREIYEFQKSQPDINQRLFLGEIPEMSKVFTAPGLLEACNQLVGEDWALVPFVHCSTFVSGGRDQHWHKDDNLPYNGRKQRHHQAVQIEMLYFPQKVTEEMGPTAVMPYSHYWTVNHEENQDNFATDHLDFNFQIENMGRQSVSDEDSQYSRDSIVKRTTAHDKRMNEAVETTQWPLVSNSEVAPLEPGSIVLYSHNMFHRGNHRRDHWSVWKDNPRFMWRFWIYRTKQPKIRIAAADYDWHKLELYNSSGVKYESIPANLNNVWKYHYHWLLTGEQPPLEINSERDSSPGDRTENLQHQLYLKGNECEPDRIGAAYALAGLSDRKRSIELLSAALYVERENVRRAATYGLVAVGPEATAVFLTAAKSQLKWIRKAGVYGLGEIGELNSSVLECLCDRLKNDSSAYVRSVAAGSVGCFIRRLADPNMNIDLVAKSFEALIESLNSEENRTSMNIVQARSIKYARPTDDCDVSEGAGMDYGFDQLRPVRSVVRENVLWSLVIICSQSFEIVPENTEDLIRKLSSIISQDQNVFSVGLAIDALRRLNVVLQKCENVTEVTRDIMDQALKKIAEFPIKCAESTYRVTN